MMEVKLNLLEDLSSNLIQETCTLKQALEQLERVLVKVLFVLSEGRFVATLTDGDVRRAILRGASLDSSIMHVANQNPIYVKEDNRNTVTKILGEKCIGALPLIDKEGKIIKIYINNIYSKKIVDENLDVPVVIMAGGLGTRLYPYTRVLPKPLIPIEGIPISERIIHSFQNIGCKEFYMVINYKKNMIRAYFSDLEREYSLHFYEEDIPLGTGGGVHLLRKQVFKTFILTNCDILILEDVREILHLHKEKNNQVTMVCSLKNFEIPYGIVNFTEGGEISSFEEKPKMSFFTNTGCYILEPSIFEYIGENEHIDMPDIIMRMKEDGQKIGLYPIGENSWLDMGRMDTIENMERKIRELKID